MIDYYDNRWHQEGVLSEAPNKERINLVAETSVNWLNKKSINVPRILDVGCGNGWILEKIQEKIGKRCELFGIEPSATGVENSLKKVPYAIVKQGALEECDFKVEFDIITCSEVIEHVKNKDAFFDKLCSFLKKDGLLVLTSPNGRYRNVYFSQCNVKPQPIEEWVTNDYLKKKLSRYFADIKVSTFDLDFFYSQHKKINTFRLSFYKLKGGWRTWVWIEKIMVNKLNLGLYLIATAKK